MMQLDWLQRLLSDRGIDARYTREMRLTADFQGRVWLDIEYEAADDNGKVFPIFKDGDYAIATEHRVLPVAGIVFDP